MGSQALVLVGIALSGCGSPPAADPPRPPLVTTATPEMPAATVIVAPPAPAATSPGPTTVRSRVFVDLDGDRQEEQLSLIGPPRDEEGFYFPGRSTGLGTSLGLCRRCTLEIESRTITTGMPIEGGVVDIVDVDPRNARHELVIVTRGSDDEDPPLVFRLLWFDGSGTHIETLGSGSLGLAGAGRIVVQHDDCFTETTTRYRLGATLVRESQRTVDNPHADECAACPYVYVQEGTELVYRGEILRDLRRAELQARQDLALGEVSAVARDGVIVVEIREEKVEVTFLDAVQLEVDGVAYSPRDCAGAHCSADHVYTQLARGESLRLEFDVDAQGEAQLVADGYYVPE